MNVWINAWISKILIQKWDFAIIDHCMNECVNYQINIQGWAQRGGRGGRKASNDSGSQGRLLQVKWNNECMNESINWLINEFSNHLVD